MSVIANECKFTGDICLTLSAARLPPLPDNDAETCRPREQIVSYGTTKRESWCGASIQRRIGGKICSVTFHADSSSGDISFHTASPRLGRKYPSRALSSAGTSASTTEREAMAAAQPLMELFFGSRTGCMRADRRRLSQAWYSI